MQKNDLRNQPWSPFDEGLDKIEGMWGGVFKEVARVIDFHLSNVAQGERLCFREEGGYTG